MEWALMVVFLLIVVALLLPAPSRGRHRRGSYLVPHPKGARPAEPPRK